MLAVKAGAGPHQKGLWLAGSMPAVVIDAGFERLLTWLSELAVFRVDRAAGVSGLACKVWRRPGKAQGALGLLLGGGCLGQTVICRQKILVRRESGHTRYSEADLHCIPQHESGRWILVCR